MFSIKEHFLNNMVAGIHKGSVQHITNVLEFAMLQFVQHVQQTGLVNQPDRILASSTDKSCRQSHFSLMLLTPQAVDIFNMYGPMHRSWVTVLYEKTENKWLFFHWRIMKSTQEWDYCCLNQQTGMVHVFNIHVYCKYKVNIEISQCDASSGQDLSVFLI